MGVDQVFATQAASGSAGNQPGGLFMLAWGVMASLGGLMAVTNFRGFADKEARHAQMRGVTQRWLFPPRDPDASFRRNRALIALVGAVLAIVGPLVTVAGIVATIHGHFSISETAAVPAPFRYFFIAVGAFVVALSWTPRLGGYALTIARQSRWRCAAAIAATVGAATFVVSVAYGRLTIGIEAWLASGLLALALFVIQPRDKDHS